MIGKYFDGQVPGLATSVASSASIIDLPAAAKLAVAETAEAMDAFDLSTAAAAAIGLLRKVDAYINATEPFKVAKDPARKDELASILYQCAECVRIASVLLEPILCTKMPELWQALSVAGPTRGTPLSRCTEWGGLKPGMKVTKVALFPRVELLPPAA